MMFTKVHVGNLNWKITDEDLYNAFSSYGEILDFVVMHDRDSGRSRGFGFVTFSLEQEAQNAIANLNERELDGRPIRVSLAKPRGAGVGGGYVYRGSRSYGGGGQGGYSGGYGAIHGSFGQPAFGTVLQGGYGQQGFQQHGYGGGGYGGQGGYQQGGYSRSCGY